MHAMAAFDEQMPAPAAHVLRVSSIDKLAELICLCCGDRSIAGLAYDDYRTAMTI